MTYAWNLVSGDAGAVQAEALDQATLNVTFGAVGEYVYELSVSDGEEVTKVKVPITVYVATVELSNVIAKFADRVSPQGKLVRNADDFTPESWQTLQAALTEAKELLARDDYSLDDVQSMTNRVRVAEESLRYRNAALLATPSASYTSAWESLNSMNDGYIPLVPGSIGNPEIETQYGNWGSPNQSHWVEYTWKTPVTLSGSSIYFYDDGGGVQVPADYDFEYWDQETGEYVAVSGLSEKKMEKGKFNQVTFNEVTTDKLRLTMKNQSSSVYTGLKEWRAISAKPEGEEPPQTDHGPITAIEPASVNTTINVMPELPSQVTVTFEDKTKGLANVVWDEIPENKLSIATDFVVLGSVEGTDLRASLRIYVKYDKSRLKAAIDAASDPSVNEENYVGTPEQWQTLQTALQLASEVYNNDASTEGDIDSAYKALLEAFEALEPVEEHNVTIIGINIPGGSVDQLAKEIVIPETTTLEELKTGLNVPASVTFAVYESDGLTSAIDLKTGYKVTLTGSDQITTKTYTVLKVTENPPVNTAALQAKLNEVRALNQERYTAASWQNLTEKISTAEQLLTSGSASQADIDAAVIALDSAIAGLKLLPTPTPTPSPSPSAPTPVPAPAPTPIDPKELAPVTVSQGRIEVKAAATGKDGKVKVQLRDSDMQAALEDMKDGKLTIVIQKDSEIQQVEALLPWKTLSTTKSLTSVKIETGSTVLTIPHQFLTTIRDITNLGVVIEAVEPSQLPKQAGKLLEADLVSNITVNVDGKSISSKELHGKGLRLAMPYQLKEGIKGHQVVAFTLNDAGVAHAIVGGRYDESTKMFEFNMEQNGMFGVLGVNTAFKDLNNVNWALEGIEALAARGAIEGTGAGEFNPTSQVTRAEFLKTLMNSFDLLDESAKPSFSDVKEGTWYSTPIASAHKLGIVKGKANGTFGPNEPITREEMAVMIYRLAGNLNVTLSTEEEDDSAKFVDLENLSSESSSAVEAVRKGGLITGMPDGRFIPNGQTTRAQAVTVIYRLLTNLEK
ncbi:Ig domain protein [Paenibacillus illinoisensis]|uniref:Ig domain protein n=1 Tax=Paenibacillus illinoisensis TaxID=59845 RepID=A0A2W0CIN8_9BACL|nr:Ig domain protein [Paenibacillus illinoisensis]